MTTLYPNRPGGKSLAEIRVSDVSDLESADLAALADDAMRQAGEVCDAQPGPGGSFKSLDDLREHGRLKALADAATMRLRMGGSAQEYMRKHPRAVVRAGMGETRDGTYAPRGRLRNARWGPPEFVSRAGWVVDDMAEVFRLGDDARDRALGALEERGEELGLRPAQLDRADRLVRSVLSAENPNCDGGYI